MKEGLTEMVLVLDKSGSMGSTKKDVIGGLNTFIEEQKKVPGEATFTLVQFDSKMELKFLNKNIKDIPTLTEDDYKPNGTTALLESTIKTIDEVGARLAALKEEDRPEKVIFAIMTDGEENSSGAEFTKELLAEKIKHQTDVYKWTFLFLGANIDVFADAKSYNIPLANSMSYTSSVDLGARGFVDYCQTVSLARAVNTEIGTTN